MEQNEHLVVVWSSGDREVALTMIFMYTINSKTKGWWKDITFIIWGPSANLIDDPEIRKNIKEMKNIGIKIEACKACSDHFGVSDALESSGIDVKYMGELLTKYLKSGSKVITF